MGICSPGSLPLYTVMFDAMLLSDLANKFSLSLSLVKISKTVVELSRFSIFKMVVIGLDSLLALRHPLSSTLTPNQFKLQQLHVTNVKPPPRSCTLSTSCQAAISSIHRRAGPIWRVSCRDDINYEPIPLCRHLNCHDNGSTSTQSANIYSPLATYYLRFRLLFTIQDITKGPMSHLQYIHLYRTANES